MKKQYALNCILWYRETTDEWVLDLQGVINDTEVAVKHTQPGYMRPEDAVGLTSLYIGRDNG